MSKTPKGLFFLAGINITLSVLYLISLSILFEEQPSEKALFFIILITFLLYITGIGLIIKHYLFGFIVGNFLGFGLIILSILYLSNSYKILFISIYSLGLLILINFKYKKLFIKFSILKSPNKKLKYSFNILTSLILVLLSILFFLHIQYNPELFSSIRYKHFGGWYKNGAKYKFLVKKSKSLEGRVIYLHKIIVYKNLNREVIHWNNDTTYWLDHEYDSLLNYDPIEVFMSYDPSIIEIKDSLIIPHKVGRTRLVYKDFNGMDTIEIVVSKISEELLNSKDDTLDVYHYNYKFY